MPEAFALWRDFPLPSKCGGLAGPGGRWKDKVPFLGHSHLSTQWLDGPEGGQTPRLCENTNSLSPRS